MTQAPETVLGPGLYIVATPIGNLADITLRAIEVLRAAGVVACEDSRVTGRLLRHLGLNKRMVRYDDHASEETRDYLLNLAASEPVALVSDAGTPLISDPGYRLVRAARERKLSVTSIPGPSAAVTALTLSGLPTDRFLFAGFLPAKTKARNEALAELSAIPATLVLYESGPRLAATLGAIAETLPGREVAVARELTKLYEECRTGSAEVLASYFSEHPPRGEIVVVVGPQTRRQAPGEAEIDGLLRAELQRASPSQAAARLARDRGLQRKALYARALELRDE